MRCFHQILRVVPLAHRCPMLHRNRIETNTKSSLRIAETTYSAVRKSRWSFVFSEMPAGRYVRLDFSIMESRERKLIGHSASNVDEDVIPAVGTGLLLSSPRRRPAEGIDGVGFGIGTPHSTHCSLAFSKTGIIHPRQRKRSSSSQVLA